MTTPTLLLGYTYSLDRMARVAKQAGIKLVLPSKAAPLAQRMGLPILDIPSFETDPRAAMHLNGQIKEQDIDAFWPLSLARFDVSGVTACPVHAVTTPTLFNIVDDKTAFANWLGYDPVRPEGIETYGADKTMAEIWRRLNVGENVCLKPPRGVNGGLFWEISLDDGDVLGMPESRKIGPALYEAALREREAKIGPERMLVMERLYGPELSVDALCINGDLAKWMVREKIAVARQIVRSSHPVINHVRRIAKTLELHGVVSVQYMYDRAGNPKILEINLRPSGGCAAYGETALAAAGTTGLLTDWLRYMGGLITRDDITPWEGEVPLHIRATAFVE